MLIMLAALARIEGNAAFCDPYWPILDKWARYLSHMGWGLMKTGDWFAAAMYGKDDIMGMDARAFAGSFLWSTGPHPVLGRDSYAHLDIGMRACTVSIDGIDVVTEGRLVEN